MANMQLLKTRIEQFVRERLKEKYHQEFRSESLWLAGCSGKHEFDAVSRDHRIVCGIKSSSGVTSGGKNPSGKIASAYQELYFLAAVEADQRTLIVTDEGFYDIISKETQGKLVRGIEIKHCQLSAELAQLAKNLQSKASEEIDRGKQTGSKAVL